MNNFINELKKNTFKIINNKFYYKENKLKIDKNNNFKNLDIKFSPKLIKYSKNNDIELLSNVIKNYLIVMSKKCKNFDTKIFLKNFKRTLFNIKSLSKNIKKGTNGIINFKDLIYIHLYTLKVINHELLHLSSSEEDITNEYFLPFDEGYTQLLAERYFEENIGKGYYFEVLILNNIETILGRDFLETEYFKGNLAIALKKITEYESSENFKILIAHIYQISNIVKNDDFENMNQHMQYSLDKVFNILFSCLKNKIKNTDDYMEKWKILNDINLTKEINLNIDGKVYKYNLIDEEVFIDYKNSVLYDSLNIEDNTKSLL